MTKHNLNDLQAFLAVARERSFTRAAAQLGVSRSALSHSMLALEARLGVRLLIRTTRSVSTTDAGRRLLDVLGPKLDDIDQEISVIKSLQDRPAGTVRITAPDHAISSFIWPRLSRMLVEYPDINVEMTADYALTDIAAQRFDAGVRLGDEVNQNMIAVRISPDVRMGVLASPRYLAGRVTPQTPKDLENHRCINLRLPTYGGLYAWELQKGADRVAVQVEGQATFNNLPHMIRAAVDGLGIVYTPIDIAQPHLDDGQLVPILEDWWPQFTGYHLYYPSRHHLPPALSLVIDTLRWR